MSLKFRCTCCKKSDISFSLLDVSDRLSCEGCHTDFYFEQSLLDSIKKFSDLCESIEDAAPILGDANVTVSVKDSSVQIPFNLLFIRFPVTLKLKMGDEDIEIYFVFDALKKSCLHLESSICVE